MRHKINFKDTSFELRLFQRRLLISALLILCLILVLLVRLCWLQLIEHHRYRTLSKQNQLSLIPIAPNRGLIFDRNGVLLAKNIPVFSLDLIPDKIANLEKTIDELSRIIPISKTEQTLFQAHYTQHRRFEKMTLKQQLTPDEVARFSVNQYRFPGVSVDAHLLRYYPLGAAMVDVLGYVGRINESELQRVDKANYSATNRIGKLGIEKYYESTLHGTVGNEQVETDASGRVVRVIKRTPPIPGNNLYLTIDSRLQVAAEKALGKHRGAIVAIQPSTGQVLALVSMPAYDPNPFVKGISQKAFQALQQSPDEPLFNRAIRGRYPPGSIVKPIYALAGLAKGVISPTKAIYDKGWFQLPNSTHRYRGYKHRALGWITISDAIIQSSDIFFYELSRKLKIHGMSAILNAFGFGGATGIDMQEELPGLVPTPAWKRANRGKPWYRGDTVITGIGQGFLLATPLQMASATAAISMRGKRFKPYLVLKQENFHHQDEYTEPVPLPKVTLPGRAWNIVIKAMENVIRSPKGTGYRFGRPPYTAAVKTGTAQLFTVGQNEQYDELTVPERLRDNSTFVGFAPVKHPEIAVAVVVQNSRIAPNVARKVMDAYLLPSKKQDA